MSGHFEQFLHFLKTEKRMVGDNKSVANFVGSTDGHDQLSIELVLSL